MPIHVESLCSLILHIYLWKSNEDYLQQVYKTKYIAKHRRAIDYTTLLTKNPPNIENIFATRTLHASVCTKCVCATCFRLLIACTHVDAHRKCVNAYRRLQIIFLRILRALK